MDEWGFVLLAYGIAFILLVSYTMRIKRKIKRLEAEVRAIESDIEGRSS